MFNSIRAKMIQDELFNLYKESHEAWTWAPKGAVHRRYALKVDERIARLEEKLNRLLGAGAVLEVVQEKVHQVLDNHTQHPVT